MHKEKHVENMKESLGVVWAIKHFRPYLYGHSCDVYTDHEALMALLNTPYKVGKEGYGTERTGSPYPQSTRNEEC